ncbi:MAG: radical SAM protein, partial [Arenicella sp.]|nr:radical SAM protein [Arenicella sp.]
ADNPRICPHLHLSQQSGSTMVLKRMKRRYDADQVLERIGKLRSKLPHVVMSADVMVGFPTETEAQYLETERMLQTLNIAYPHVFSYSERQGTPAARIPQDKQVPVTLRKQRNKRLRDSVVGLQEQLLASKIGYQAWVLPEQQSSKAAWTLCRGEDYVACQVDSGKAKPGRWMKVRFDRLENGQLVAE